MAASDSVLIEIVDHELRAWQEVGYEEVLRRIRPLLRRLARDGRIANILAQLVEEAGQEEARVAAELRDLCRRARTIWETEKDLLLPLDSDGANDFPGVAVFGEQLSKIEGAVQIDSDSVQLIDFQNLMGRLREWFALLKDGAGEPALARVRAGSAAANQLELEFESLQQRVALAEDERPGACVVRLREVAEALEAPPPVADADAGEVFQYMTARDGQKGLRNAYTDPHHFETSGGQGARETAERAVRDGLIVLEEVRLRLALGWSRRATVQRFAARCTRFDGDRLRGVCASGSGKVEDHLAVELAQYLFDDGLTPFFNVDVGGVRPDLLDPGGSPPYLYVEAKQYGHKAPNPAEVQKWASQVWSTWDYLDQAYPGKIPEAFLVIFRWGSGAPLALPRLVASRGRVLYPVLVDIAPNEVRGCRAPQQRGVKEAELLPVVQVEAVEEKGA